jgi:hypothetical protein
MLSAAPELACTSTELILLASLRGAKMIVGISDPLHGRSPDEVAAALAAARDGLAARRYLTVDADGTLTLDFDVARVVDAVTRPRRTLLAFVVSASAVAAPETGARRVFHVRGSLTVSMTDWRGGVRLVPLAGRAAIADAVLDFWSVGDQPPAPGGSAIVPRQTLHAAARAAATLGLDACESDLLDAGVAPGAASSLAATLTRPRGNAALLALDIGGQSGRMLGVGMLAGYDGLWRLRPLERDGVASVEVKPCSGPQLAEIVRDFVRVSTAN